MKKKNKFIQNSQGAVLVELALVLPILTILILGIIDFGIVVASKNKLNSVTNAGLLYAFGVSSNPDSVKNKMLTSTNLDPLTINVVKFCQCLDGIEPGCDTGCGDGSFPGTYVKTTTTYDVDLIGPNFVLSNPFTIKSEGTIRVND